MEEKDRKAVRGRARVVWRVNAALMHAREADGSRNRDEKSFDAIVRGLTQVRCDELMHGVRDGWTFEKLWPGGPCATHTSLPSSISLMP